MKKTLLLTLSLLLLSSSLSPARAVESGTDATGNSVVVPIKTEATPDSYYGCSGALIMPSVVVTAAHCVLDSNGLTSKNILVGPPGTSNVYNSQTWAKVITVNLSVDYLGSGVGHTIGDADIAVLVLDKLFPLTTVVTLASENQLLTFRATSVKLKVVGYGYTSDSGNSLTTPNSYEATYTQIISSDINQSWAESSSAGACQGDSGGPVLVTTPQRIFILGVVTGGHTSIHCSKVEANGKKLVIFTILNRFANLAMVSAAESFADQQARVEQLSSSVTKSQSDQKVLSDSKSALQYTSDKLSQQIEDLQKQLDTANTSISDLQKQLDTANTSISDLQKKLPSTITCTKGKLSQKVTAVTPKCPTGYKIKV